MAKKTHNSPEEARAAILDAAEETVFQVGPAGLRISAVAKKAGMAHPNIIHHFGSREGLINALAERVGERATERITNAISEALNAPEQDKVAALTHVLDTAYPGDEGRVAVWLHLSGAESSLKPNMQRIVELSHELRKSINDEVDFGVTNRLVMLVTLALVGEVVSGAGIKDALGFGSEESNRAHFRQWLAEILLKLSDEELLTTGGNNNPTSDN
ncbi:MAG: TetR/AcrR family transcriptional regulator [Pseudomonadota bacterium]